MPENEFDYWFKTSLLGSVVTRCPATNVSNAGVSINAARPTAESLLLIVTLPSVVVTTVFLVNVFTLVVSDAKELVVPSPFVKRTISVPGGVSLLVLSGTTAFTVA